MAILAAYVLSRNQGAFFVTWLQLISQHFLSEIILTKRWLGVFTFMRRLLLLISEFSTMHCLLVSDASEAVDSVRVQWSVYYLAGGIDIVELVRWGIGRRVQVGLRIRAKLLNPTYSCVEWSLGLSELGIVIGSRLIGTVWRTAQTPMELLTWELLDHDFVNLIFNNLVWVAANDGRWDNDPRCGLSESDDLTVRCYLKGKK
jgi:hypothetical protein